MAEPTDQEMKEVRKWAALVEEAMSDSWNNICEDTKCHPLDIEHEGEEVLSFTPRHWARSAGERVAYLVATALREVRERTLEEAAQCAIEELCVEGGVLIADRIRSLLTPGQKEGKNEGRTALDDGTGPGKEN